MNLSPKQSKVLTLVADGLSNRQIGTRLNVSVRTVETHRERLMDRLNIRGTANLTRYALAKENDDLRRKIKALEVVIGSAAKILKSKP